MPGLSLCVDIDGTLTEPHYWLQRANRHFGTSLLPEAITCYEVHQALGVEATAYERFYREHGELLHAEATIRAGAQQVLSELYTKHAVHIVTAREERMRDVSLAWLQQHGIPLDSISLLGHPNKVQRAAELRSDFFLEDSLDNAIQLAGAGFEVLLVDCSYNRAPLPPLVTRVHDWFEIGQIVRRRADAAATRVAN